MFRGHCDLPTVQEGRDGFQRYGSNLRNVSLWRRPSTHTVSNTLATSRKIVPVSLFSSKFPWTLSTRLASCSAVLCLDPNPNCSLRRNPRPLTSLRILVSRILSNSLPIVSSWRGSKRGQPWILPGFQGGSHAPYFHAGGKYCVRKIAFTTLTRKNTTISGGCFRATFGLTFGPGVWRTDRRYRGSHSPHCYDVLLSPSNHRAASQVVASPKWWGFPSA